MPVHHVSPGAGLDHAVAALWVRLPDRSSRESATPVRVLPDGSIDLIWRFRQHAPGQITDAQLYVAGIRSRWHWASADSRTTFVGVRLLPGMSRLLLRVDPADLAGIDPPATTLDPTLAGLADRLAAVASPGRMLAVLRREVRRRVTSASGRRLPPSRVRRALTLLRHDDPTAAIAAIAVTLEVSPRTLHRDIVEWAGLPPKTLARIHRFQAALGQLRRRADIPLARLAHEAGYADHAHMTREFKELAGVPPSAGPPG